MTVFMWPAGFKNILKIAGYANILNGEEDEMNRYAYGMRLRGCSPGAQPKGIVERLDDEAGRYYDIIVYERQLTPGEIEDYELDEL